LRRAALSLNNGALTHQAFAFDYAAFHDQLRPLLLKALAANDGAELRAFIDANLDHLTDPYEGEPLVKGWQGLLEKGDVHELGDFALTKYYDSDLDIGLDVDWENIGDLLEQSGVSPTIVLGTALGPVETPFDPGRQGAYFQTAAEVSEALVQLQALLQKQPALASELAPLQGMLQQAARGRRGLYVTL
jgi:hypothetical protein